MNDDSNKNGSGTPPENPWSDSQKGQRKKSSGGNQGSPWGSDRPKINHPFGGGGGGGRGGDDLNEWFKDIRGRIPGGGGSDFGGMLWMGGLILLLIWMASGIYRVQPEEHAVITRFGSYQKTVIEQGLHYHLPPPIERAEKPNVTFERRIEIGYRDPSGGRTGSSNVIDKPEESLMLTGDANIVDIDLVIQWKVGSAKDFLFNIRDPEGTIKKVAESAMRAVIGQNNLQGIITEQRGEVASEVRTNMQAILDNYGAGVMVTQVLIQDASVPQPVMGAFEDVIRADQDAETLKNQAQQYRNDIIPRARGEAIQMIKKAEGYRERVINEANGAAEKFTKLYNSYKPAKAVTRKRMYLEAMENLLSQSNKIVMDPGEKGSSVLPYLPLEGLRTGQNKSRNGN